MNSYSSVVLSEEIISVVFAVVFFVSSVCVFLYRKFSLRVGILANPNFRTLHETPVPNGGGIVFSLVFFL